MLLLLLAPHAAYGAEDRPHSLAFKTGYHFYPAGSYLRLTGSFGLGGRSELQGPSLEFLDYTYRWSPTWSLNATVFGGYFQKYTPLQTLQQSLVTTYATLTPIYRLAGSDRIGAWGVYTGVGVGRYTLTLRFDDKGSTEEFSDHTLGYHVLIGTEYRFSEQVGFLIEEKYARARVTFGKDLDRTSIDLGGHNLLVGARIHF